MRGRRRGVCLGLATGAASALLVAPGFAQVKASEHATISQTIDGTTITIEYSRPSLRGRTIRGELFGDQIAWGHTWTPGANWATLFEANKDVVLDGVPVPAGRYSVWMKVDPDVWEVVLDPRDSLYHVARPEPSDDQIRFPATPTTAA